MDNPFVTAPVKAGTAGGVLTILITQISSADILKTAILTSVGAIVSFSVSMLLKWVVKKCNRISKRRAG